MNKTDLTKIPGIGKNMAQHLNGAALPSRSRLMPPLVESWKRQDSN